MHISFLLQVYLRDQLCKPAISLGAALLESKVVGLTPLPLRGAWLALVTQPHYEASANLSVQRRTKSAVISIGLVKLFPR